MGGDRLDYPGVTATDTASLSTTKLLLNSVISTPVLRFLTMDIKNYYYGTPMAQNKYMRSPLDLTPEEVVKQYNLAKIAVNGWVYM